jgi:hypothetical protein
LPVSDAAQLLAWWSLARGAGAVDRSSSARILIASDFRFHYSQRMHKRNCVFLILLSFLLGLQSAHGQAPERSPLVLDDSVWVTFYDLPSRRFRSIRDAFVRRDFDAVQRDLETTLGFIRIEAERAVDELAPAFADNIGRLERLRTNLEGPDVTISHLDAAFAQSHWVLAQHYLVQAIESRDGGHHRNAGRYLVASAHHLERAVLWSNARITGDVVESLEDIRDMASRLAQGENPDRVYRDRPLRLAGRTMREIGEHIDRQVRIEPLLPE